ncbi:MAG: hypothetical protein QP807_08515 [Staphylococcus epidermidis]|uniref:transcriptional regulator, SarA/Rot family n=1 Tax=Staphylococcus epidermidis TaxID=1282 RepID=UPI00254AA595|nr:hypothetical protein [Staphylococcus epidermidis]MDK7341660.1 hypothetical protein [Staphylococcus epidermidis]MDK7943721.1 hypothetical protein [Staphylococcus epidermidis]MDK8321674.1 hypothetical protein [Staphylococcus epidermidis]
MYRKRTVIWPFYFYTIIRTLSNHILKSESNEISSKEIATCSEFKPYYLTKALQKLKDLNLLSKKRSVHDERTVIVFVSDEQREKIEKLILELENYIK